MKKTILSSLFIGICLYPLTMLASGACDSYALLMCEDDDFQNIKRMLEVRPQKELTKPIVESCPETDSTPFLAAGKISTRAVSPLSLISLCDERSFEQTGGAGLGDEVKRERSLGMLTPPFLVYLALKGRLLVSSHPVTEEILTALARSEISSYCASRGLTVDELSSSTTHLAQSCRYVTEEILECLGWSKDEVTQMIAVFVKGGAFPMAREVPPSPAGDHDGYLSGLLSYIWGKFVSS